MSTLVTPLMHHAPAVLVMGPIAAAVAKNLGYGPRAVQRSTHEPHAQNRVDAAEGDAMPCIGDVTHLIEAQNVGGEGA